MDSDRKSIARTETVDKIKKPLIHLHERSIKRAKQEDVIKVIAEAGWMQNRWTHCLVLKGNGKTQWRVIE